VKEIPVLALSRCNVGMLTAVHKKLKLVSKDKRFLPGWGYLIPQSKQHDEASVHCHAVTSINETFHLRRVQAVYKIPEKDPIKGVRRVIEMAPKLIGW